MKNKMRTILICFTLLACSAAYAQEVYRTNEVDRAKIIKISPDAYKALYMVESQLDKNFNNLDNNILEVYDPYISTIRQAFNNSKLSASGVAKIEAVVCIDCYNWEWDNQRKLLSEAQLLLQEKKQSLRDLEAKANVLTQTKKESVSISSDTQIAKPAETKVNPYELLERSLYAFSKANRYLAVFRNTDYNWSASQLSSYLQSQMSLASKDFKYGSAVITQKFIPKASSKSEFLNLQYKVTHYENIVGYMDSEEVAIVNDLEITGTPDLIVSLFLNYWPGTLKIGGYKKGEIANKQLMGDRISIYGVNPNLYKITVSKGDMDVDYKTTYGINQTK